MANIASASQFPNSRWQAVVQAVFLDVPYVLDSLWRRSEFNRNRLGELNIAGAGTFVPRALFETPFAILFSALMVFFCFGPTLNSVCAATNGDWVAALRAVLGLAVIVTGVVYARRFYRGCHERLSARSVRVRKDCPGALTELLALRLRIATALFIAGALLVAVPLLGFGAYQLGPLFQGLHPPAGGLGSALQFVKGLTQFGQGSVAFDPHACVHSEYAGAAWAQLAITAVALGVGLLILRRKWGARRQAWLLFILLAVIASLLWLVVLPLGAPNVDGHSFAATLLRAREADGGPYIHLFAVSVLVFFLVSIYAQRLAAWCFSKLSPDLLASFRRSLETTELLGELRTDPRLTRVGMLASVINGVTYHPMHVLLLPAFGVLLTESQYVWLTATLLVFISVIQTMWGALSARWGEALTYLERWFLDGTPLVVSLAVVVIAILRLADFQYVATILDSAPFGVLLSLIVMAYTASWFTEFWVNRWVGEELLGVLGASRPQTGFLYYGPPINKPDQTIVKQGEVLALHGVGRFAVYGWYWIDDESVEADKRRRGFAFTTYGYQKLFAALGEPLDQDYTDTIRRRLRLYFNLVNASFLAVFVGFVLLRNSANAPLAQEALVSAVDKAVAKQPFDLADAIIRQNQGPGRSALIVAASGGGVRAALYTATALEGLARLNRVQNVVLLSGVSGGGVAAAYFADRRGELSKPWNQSRPQWLEFKEVMGEPFIEDVLAGATEWRISYTTPLTSLLAESFDRRIFTDPARKTVGDIEDVGLILNTSVSGHPRQDSAMLNGRVGVEGGPRNLELSRPYSLLSGIRLVFTNVLNADRDLNCVGESGVQGDSLADCDLNSPYGRQLPDVRFMYKVVSDPSVELSKAAALSANFSPVFPNARVRLRFANCCDAYSYFVTDGGATENLGLLSALYALRAEIPRIRSRLMAGERFPHIHIIAIEASAITYDYTQDRGVGAATGGSKDRLAGGLTQEVLASVRAELPSGDRNAIEIHYLALPLAFRSRGGFGTHWMSARTIRVSNPLIAEPRGRIEQWWRQSVLNQPHFENLTEPETQQVWDELFDPDQDKSFCREDRDSSARPQRAKARVEGWICGRDSAIRQRANPDWVTTEWQQLLKELPPVPE
jgi:hypothetical protein